MDGYGTRNRIASLGGGIHQPHPHEDARLGMDDMGMGIELGLGRRKPCIICRTPTSVTVNSISFCEDHAVGGITGVVHATCKAYDIPVGLGDALVRVLTAEVRIMAFRAVAEYN